jgi:hypothetical protein
MSKVLTYFLFKEHTIKLTILSCGFRLQHYQKPLIIIYVKIKHTKSINKAFIFPTKMRKSKTNSILLYKESSTQADSRGLNISASKSRLINELKNTPHGYSTPRIKPNDYTLQNQSLKAYNMEDPQPRIKRDFSPLYQKSTQ